jgi:putative CocE/NonD family hydrolase
LNIRSLRQAAVLCAALSLAATLPAASASTAPVDTKVEAEASVAEALLARYSAATTPDDMKRLYRLQIAAGLYEAAESSIDRLQAIYRPDQPRQASGLVPWRIYVRAKRHEARGMEADAALKTGFGEIFGALSDTQMAEVLPDYRGDLERVRDQYAVAAKACADTVLRDCASAADVIAARQAVLAWTALWPASAPLIRADAERRFVVDDRVLVQTPDGARIAAMIVRPREPATAKRVALLNFTIYARDDWSFADAVKMAAHGYAGVVAYTRGKGASPGPAVPYEHDGADAATVIEWLARQPWSDGRVGMFSGSYNASTQWAAVKHRPAALKAIATNASNAPGIDAPMQGNVFQTFMYPWPFYTTNTKGLDDKTYGDSARWAALERNWYVRGRPYRDLDRIDGAPNPIFDRWLEHPDYDAYWQSLIPFGEEFAKVDIPVFVQTGYYDGGMVGALYYLEQHYRYRPSAEHRLLVGPYHHTAMQTGVLPTVRGYEVDQAAKIDLQDVRLKWFDHVFHGAPMPDVLRDRINFQVMGANRWRHASSLASMANKPLRLYLTGQREGARLLFSKTAPVSGPEPELHVDLADRSDVDAAPSADGVDRNNALVFATAPLTKPTEVDGLFKARFRIVTNKRDFDLSVDFYERRADGTMLPLASYLGRASYMADRSRRQLLRPGQQQMLAFTSQTVTARLLAPGSRILAVIAIPKRPDTQINYGTGRAVSDESIADAGRPIEIRWRLGSYFDLAVR